MVTANEFGQLFFHFHHYFTTGRNVFCQGIESDMTNNATTRAEEAADLRLYFVEDFMVCLGIFVFFAVIITLSTFIERFHLMLKPPPDPVEFGETLSFAVWNSVVVRGLSFAAITYSFLVTVAATFTDLIRKHFRNPESVSKSLNMPFMNHFGLATSPERIALVQSVYVGLAIFLPLILIWACVFYVESTFLLTFSLLMGANGVLSLLPVFSSSVRGRVLAAAIVALLMTLDSFFIREVGAPLVLLIGAVLAYCGALVFCGLQVGGTVLLCHLVTAVVLPAVRQASVDTGSDGATE